MVYADTMPGPKAYEDETGARSVKRLPLIPVTAGEYDAAMEAWRLDEAKSYADWARPILMRAAKKAGAKMPKKRKAK